MAPRFVLALVLGSALVMPVVGVSLADDNSPPATDDPSAGEAADFACGVQPATFKNGGSSRATFTCWVRGAPASDTTFSVEVVRRGDAAGGSRTLGAANGTLLDGAGTCSLEVTDAAGFFLAGGVYMAGSLQPSGTPLGPVFANPTLAAS
jgi:hypothetical protein